MINPRNLIKETLFGQSVTTNAGKGSCAGTSVISWTHGVEISSHFYELGLRDVLILSECKTENLSVFSCEVEKRC